MDRLDAYTLQHVMHYVPKEVYKLCLTGDTLFTLKLSQCPNLRIALHDKWLRYTSYALLRHLRPTELVLQECTIYGGQLPQALWDHLPRLHLLHCRKVLCLDPDDFTAPTRPRAIDPASPLLSLRCHHCHRAFVQRMMEACAHRTRYLVLQASRPLGRCLPAMPRLELLSVSGGEVGTPVSLRNLLGSVDAVARVMTLKITHQSRLTTLAAEHFCATDEEGSTAIDAQPRALRPCFAAITRLQISSCALERFPAALAVLTSLLHLDVSANVMIELDESALRPFRRLVSFDAKFNRLSRVCIAPSAGLTTLCLSNNRIRHFSLLTHRCALETLAMNGDVISAIVDDPSSHVPMDVVRVLEQCPHLKELHLSGLSSMPLSFADVLLTLAAKGVPLPPLVSLHAWYCARDETMRREDDAGGSLSREARHAAFALPHLYELRARVVAASREAAAMRAILRQAPRLGILDVTVWMPLTPGEADAIPAAQPLLAAKDAALSALPRLTHLNLDGAALADGAALCGLRTLRVLTLSNIDDVRIPEGVFPEMACLETLQIVRSYVRALPRDVGSLGRTLAVLHIADTNFGALPDSVGALRYLRELFLTDNDRLTSLANVDFSRMPHLAIASFACCALRALPASLGACAALTFLSLEHNRVSRLPSTWSALRQCQTLHAGHNRFTGRGGGLDALAGMTSLSELRLSGCAHLDTLPDRVLSPLVRLARLDLAETALTTLSSCLASPALEHLNVSGCAHLSTIPTDFARYNTGEGVLDVSNCPMLSRQQLAILVTHYRQVIVR